MDHCTRTGRPFPRNVYRVLERAEISPVTNRAIANSLSMIRTTAGYYLVTCRRRGYLLKSGNIYTLSAAGRHRLNFLRQNDPENPC